MPLFKNAEIAIRINLEKLKEGRNVRVIKIGSLTATQLEAINSARVTEGLHEIVGEIIFIGRHIYKRRINDDGYKIEDVVSQIASALDSNSVAFVAELETAIQNPSPRNDGYGNLVNDKARFECTAYRPNPELRTIIPKGDKIRPKMQKGR